MTNIITPSLCDIPETMLIPLYCKAAESKHKNPIISDPKSVEIIDRIDYDFSKFSKIWMSQLGVAIRTKIFDQEILRFIKHHKDTLIINLGCGLDTRSERLKNAGAITWYDLDVPEAIELRRKFFSESEHNHFISKSIFDFSWMDNIEDKGRPVLFIAEGVFMYFSGKEIQEIFSKLTKRFSGAEMLFETISPLFVGRSKQHDAVKQTSGKAEFKWGLKNGKEMEKWNDHIEYLNQWDYFDYHPERVKPGFRALLAIPGIKKNLSSRIIHLRFK